VAWHRSNEDSCKLEKVPGIGPLTASALGGQRRRREDLRERPGRWLRGWAGTATTLQRGKPTLLGISKRGDAYLRNFWFTVRER